MRYRVLPYRQGSRGASELATGLGGRVLRLEGSRFVPRRDDVIINWGNANPPAFAGARVFNGRGIRDASNKLNFFQSVKELDREIIPRYWTGYVNIPADAFPIVCRTVLAGHSGEGIVIANTPAELVPAPLYVQYVKKQDEYRVHVGLRNGIDFTIIDVQQKKRRQEHENPNWQVRNLANGFIYARDGVNPPDCVLDVARRALACTDLDFGAVDVIYNARENRAYVLEVNTAPGITGTTVDRYVDFFRRN
jgi:hypothetical protein